MTASKAVRDQRMASLRAAGYAVASMEADTRVNMEVNTLLFATMHRAKGLEFADVILTVVSPIVHRCQPVIWHFVQCYTSGPGLQTSPLTYKT